MSEPELDGKRSLLSALNAGSVEFIVIGGLAVGAHGFPRATKDIDIVPEPTLTNLERLATVLAEPGFDRLDIHQHVEPETEYAELKASSIVDEVFGQRVRFCGFEHLVAMKEAAGRDQDLVDLVRLRELRD